MTTVVRRLLAVFVNSSPRTWPTTNTCQYTFRGTLVLTSLELTFRKKNINKTGTRERGSEPAPSKTTSDRMPDESE